MTRVKICGIQESWAALEAAQAGADYLGFVFVPGRRRRLPEEKAPRVIREVRDALGPARPRLVGLFADQPMEEVRRVVEICGLDMVQLCGEESPEYCRLLGLPGIKVVHVRPDALQEQTIPGLVERMHDYAREGLLVTLDRYQRGLQGGTGRAFDWSVAQKLSHQGHSFLLAGGLTPDNVAQAIAQVHPWGVDVSSGVETGGVKDVAKIRAFVQQVREADRKARRLERPEEFPIR